MSQTFTPTALEWSYPLSSPSYRFTQINNYVRQLDLRFAALPGPDQADWQSAAESWGYFARCVPWVFDFDPMDSEGVTGLAAFRGCNCVNLVTARPVSDMPVTPGTLPDGDTLGPFGSDAYTVLWAGRSAPPAGSFNALVWAMPLNNEPERGPAISKYRWAGSAAIAFGNPFDLRPFLAARPGLESARVASFAVGIAGSGQNLFFGSRYHVRQFG